MASAPVLDAPITPVEPVTDPAVREPVTAALPAIPTVDPLWLMIESVTFALPPLLENWGMNLALHAVPEEHTISLDCSDKSVEAGGTLCEPALLFDAIGASWNAESGLPPSVSASAAFSA